MIKEIKRVLVANRGVPAVRIMDTLRDRKIKSVAVYSDPDRIAHHVYMADFAQPIGEGPPKESYLNIERIIDAAHKRIIELIGKTGETGPITETKADFKEGLQRTKSDDQNPPSDSPLTKGGYRGVLEC